MQSIVLGSTSTYRADLLARLRLPFRIAAPNCDEVPLPGEPPRELAERLAALKAHSLVDRFPASLVIGSDQVACVDDTILGKPGTREKAMEQLRQMQGRSVVFHTAVCVTQAQNAQSGTHLDITTARMRTLTDEEITRYIELDEPLDCAGSFKIEALGVSLFDSVHTEDPTALTGMPLIAVARLLRESGVAVP